MGLIVFLPFPSWQQLVGFITSATVLSFGSGSLVFAVLRRELPDRERSFRLPGGDVLPFLALYSSNLIVYWAGWETDWKLFVAVLLGFVLLVVFQVTDSANTPPMDWRAGAVWVLPWLGGLCLISYLGSYPDTSAGKGNLGWLSFGWGFVAILALTVLVYVLAVRFRLDRHRIEEHIADTVAEAEEEDRALGEVGA